MTTEQIPQPKRPKPFPIACLVIGMAGSGKSTLMQRLNSHLRTPTTSTPTASASGGCPVYCVNLDPAVTQCSFGANIDIRDTVKYKEVMKQYSLGPNGAIMTSLNLFATKFDQVVTLIERRAEKCGALRYVLIDTPGQIEAFTWSASGTIVTESLSAVMPTVVVYVVDVPRSVANPSTFMANMLYACSILYRTRLPLVLAMTKTDVVSHELLVRWMRDFDSFQDALRSDPSFSHDLAHSMSLVLDEFYRGLRTAGVSAISGDGVDALLRSIDEASSEYFTDFLPDVEQRKKARAEEESRKQEEQLKRLRSDLEAGRGGDVVLDMSKKKPKAKAASAPAPPVSSSRAPQPQKDQRMRDPEEEEEEEEEADDGEEFRVDFH